jgi:hypothetical protein
MTNHNDYNQVRGHHRSRNRRVHLKRNLKIRYDLTITNGELKTLLKEVQNNKHHMDKSMADGFRTYLIEFKGKRIRFLYDPYKKEFVTVLNLLSRQTQLYQPIPIKKYIQKQRAEPGTLGEAFQNIINTG